jgi:hypothetical protein
MRTKQEILKAYLDDGLNAQSDACLSMLTVVNVLEILIDIRDIIATNVVTALQILWDTTKAKGGEE